MHDHKLSVEFDLSFVVPGGSVQSPLLPVKIPQTERPISIQLELRYISSTDRIYLANSRVLDTSGGYEVRRQSKGGRAIGKSYRASVIGIRKDQPIWLADSSDAKFTSTPPFQLSSSRALRSQRNRERFTAVEYAKDLTDTVATEFLRQYYIGPLRAPPRRMYISTRVPHPFLRRDLHHDPPAARLAEEGRRE